MCLRLLVSASQPIHRRHGTESTDLGPSTGLGILLTNELFLSFVEIRRILPHHCRSPFGLGSAAFITMRRDDVCISFEVHSSQGVARVLLIGGGGAMTSCPPQLLRSQTEEMMWNFLITKQHMSSKPSKELTFF